MAAVGGWLLTGSVVTFGPEGPAGLARLFVPEAAAGSGVGLSVVGPIFMVLSKG